MKVILLRDVGGVGKRDEIKDVSDGYALNYLIPRGLAQQASAEKIAALESHAKATAESKKEMDRTWELEIKKLDGTEITIATNANEKGHLYHQLPLSEIVTAIQKSTGISVPESAIQISAPIKAIGDASIDIRYGKKTARITAHIVTEEK
jgi:large subunit ribosomal protein L9